MEVDWGQARHVKTIARVGVVSWEILCTEAISCHAANPAKLQYCVHEQSKTNICVFLLYVILCLVVNGQCSQPLQVLVAFKLLKD